MHINFMSMVYWLHADLKHGREGTNKDLTCKKYACTFKTTLVRSSLFPTQRKNALQPALSFWALLFSLSSFSALLSSLSFKTQCLTSSHLLINGYNLFYLLSRWSFLASWYLDLPVVLLLVKSYLSI